MDPVVRQRFKAQKRLPFKARLIGHFVVFVVRTAGWTMGWKIDDPEKILDREAGIGTIWLLWHNRIFALPLIYKQLAPKLRGVVLTSASRDGDYLAAIANALGVCSERGSSSKRGSRALLALTSWVAEGFVVGITPDGPRGPRYRLAPGPVKLSQMTQAEIVTFQIDYSSYWQLRQSWDHFRIPKPFSTISLTVTPTAPISRELSDEEFEETRMHIETLLNPNHETD